jgi:hypothetical protein
MLLELRGPQELSLGIFCGRCGCLFACMLRTSEALAPTYVWVRALLLERMCTLCAAASDSLCRYDMMMSVMGCGASSRV